MEGTMVIMEEAAERGKKDTANVLFCFVLYAP